MFTGGAVYAGCAGGAASTGGTVFTGGAVYAGCAGGAASTGGTVFTGGAVYAGCAGGAASTGGTVYAGCSTTGSSIMSTRFCNTLSRAPDCTASTAAR